MLLWLQQQGMFLDSPLYLLGFHADVTLGCRGTGVLQEPLYQGDVISAVLINFGGIPLSEAVGADALIAKVVADDVKLLLDRTFCHRKNGGGSLDAITQTVVLDILLNYKGHGEGSELAGLLLGNVQTVAVTISHDVAKAEFQDVTDP